MSDFDPPQHAIREVVAHALAEDLGILGDLTSLALISEQALGSGRFVARSGGVIAGTACATEVFRQLDTAVELSWMAVDGTEVGRGEIVGTLSGPLRPILTGERTALNLLSHLSGVAERTQRFVRAAGGPSRIRDTRKTLPGLRALEKAAVRAGGGFNHRECLSDAVLIKDNHLRVLAIAEAVTRARSRWPGRIVEVECDTLDQVAEAVKARPDCILLDNMAPEEVARAVELVGGLTMVEASGGITESNVGEYARTGVDFLAIGSLTHSATALDVSLDLD